MGRTGLLLAVVAVALLVAVQARDLGPHVTVQESTCWECHSSWTPALRAVAVMLPPDKEGAPIGEAFDYKVQLQSTWRADVVFASPTLDISKAPSLRFAGGHAPIDNRTSDLRITPVQTRPTEPTEPTTTTFQLPPGATWLRFTVEPEDTNPTTAPDLIMVIQPPAGDRIEVNLAPPGAIEERNFTGAELNALGAGNYEVGAYFVPFAPPDGVPPSPPKPPVLTPVEFDVRQQALFDTAGLTSLTFSRAETVGPGLSSLYTWTLVPAAEPQPGEEVRIHANVTAYYDHLGATPLTGDDDNVTHATVLSVRAEEGEVRLINENAVMVRPETVDAATIVTISEAIGYAATFLLLSSIWSGGMFGKASRRSLNNIFGSAKRRVAFHNFLSYGLTLAAAIHTVLFIVEASYAWGWGLLWGGLGLLCMLLLGVTGALQVPMVRKWSYGTWRWTHYGLTIGAILFTVVHIFLDGKNTGTIQDAVGWKGDPLRDLGEVATALVRLLF